MTPTTPAPGHPVRGSSTGRPVMAAMDLLGRRWALRVLWELSHQPLRALELKDRCDDMSSSVLYQRLRELSEAGLVIQHSDGRFAITSLGGDLRAALEPLDAWSRRWAERS
ncbi:helix-turn-helix domain-containing protein [Kribbella ginsengisoli]|uniref:Winged helix-turn-helix transcriptional regulator n=1 Tax=Kribbella ginsengisoli TaxID=363865 RepID=A0ABP6WV08_9ACTN